MFLLLVSSRKHNVTMNSHANRIKKISKEALANEPAGQSFSRWWERERAREMLSRSAWSHCFLYFIFCIDSTLLTRVWTEQWNQSHFNRSLNVWEHLCCCQHRRIITNSAAWTNLCLSLFTLLSNKKKNTLFFVLFFVKNLLSIRFFVEKKREFINFFV